MKSEKFLNFVFYVSLASSVLCYWLIGYYFDRFDSSYLIFSYVFTFFAYIAIMYCKISPLAILIIGLIFRLIFIISYPELSQDYYRFLWDGNLQLININPYLYAPNELIIKKNLFDSAIDLYRGMGELSNIHYSNYPPISQWIYFFTSFFSKSIIESVVILRCVIILFELGTFYTIYVILKYFNLPSSKVGWYFLNPLVIIELTGNLHGEGIMMFFFLLGTLFLYQKKIFQSSIIMALSIGTKLFTLIIIPLYYKKLKINKSLYYYVLMIIIFILLWLPYFNENIYKNYFQTINLWFNRFEFNASIYYLIREVGYYFKGYNIIREYGKILPFIVILAISFFTFFRKNNTFNSVIVNQLFLLSFYFLIATTIHPWYIISLITLCVFTPYFFPIIWSATIFISYSAYNLNGFNEQPKLLVFEYLIVFSFVLFEIIGGQNKIFKAFAKNPTPLK